jgi:hypothetical protein
MVRTDLWRSRGASKYRPGNWIERARRDQMPGLGVPRPPTDEDFLERVSKRFARELAMPIALARRRVREIAASARQVQPEPPVYRERGPYGAHHNPPRPGRRGPSPDKLPAAYLRAKPPHR